MTLSSCKVKYIFLKMVCQGVWLIELIDELTRFKVKFVELCVDNKSVIELEKDPTFHNRCKHIDICYHCVRCFVEDKNVTLGFVFA